ncbi:MAG TPA: site-2 protease family protein [Solirubrobacteraceae bacterium]|jgi:Zn-dependent protease|nr:site-2 protease family protein [Solirubrobacteraceae bacterium]
MANGLDVDVSLPAPTASAPSLTPIGRSYPSHTVAPAALQPAPAAPSAGPSGSAGDDPFGTHRRSRMQALRKRIGSMLAAIVALIAKFFAAIKGLLLLLPKVKFLTTTGTALISIAAYSLFFGWEFAAGFVLLLFVHEMGHVFQLRREGVPASAPMFIPGLGAVVMMKSLPDDALAEARVGLAGPILGTLGAAICLVLAEALNSDLLRALAYVAFFLNLINLIPVTPFDGGRAMAAMAPAMWFLGLGTLVALFFVTGNYFLLIFLLLGFTDTRRRWRQRKTRSIEQAAYYRVAPRHRLYVGAVYIALIVVLVLGMDVSHVLASGGHTFRSI